MALYAISDLHLGLGTNKSMDMFGGAWVNHTEKISINWNSAITGNDTVIIGGDISWAMRLKDAIADLDFIASLPGKKVLFPGNHDYWWDSTRKLNELYENMFFLKNDFYAYEEYAICATRGWLCPNDSRFSQHDEKIYNRELIRCETSLEKAVKSGYDKFVLCLHYPPTNDKMETSGFSELINKYKPEQVLYGHLHGEDFFNSSLSGMINGISYSLVSSDYINFHPRMIIG